jgi:hypothetical protein
VENIKVDLNNLDERRGYIKGLKVCLFMLNIGAMMARKSGTSFNPLAPIQRAIEELENGNVPHVG